MRLTEDDIYRTSTQYRLWSYTLDQLASLRATTNETAAQRVKAAVKRQREARKLDNGDNTDAEKNGTSTGTSTPAEKEVDCLTVAEEQKVVNAFCERAIDLGNFFKFPIEVIATGVQFLKRFYLFNSPMTYEPQAISRSVMFMATKTEGHHMKCETYASGLSNSTVEKILAPEYLVTQALRFTFDVRHPFRGLKGGHMELFVMAKGDATVLPGVGKTAQQLQQEMLKLSARSGGPASSMTGKQLEKRVVDAYAKASATLKTAAILTDAYFLYTPSQTWLAAHWLADEVLTDFYIGTKFSGGVDPTSATGIAKSKVTATIRACASLLASHRSMKGNTPEETKAIEEKDKEEVRAILTKLKNCRDPEKADLVKLNQAQKRDAGTDGKLEESKAKRRKLAREENEKEADAFWGPELPKKEHNDATPNV